MLANAIRSGDCCKLTLVVNLACGLDEILEVSASQEVTKVNELAVPLVLHVDGTPAVLTSGNVATVHMSACNQKKSIHQICSPVNVHGVLRTDNSERNDGLDLSVHSGLL